MGAPVYCLLVASTNPMLGHEWKDGVLYQEWVAISGGSWVAYSLCHVRAADCEEGIGEDKVLPERIETKTHNNQRHKLQHLVRPAHLRLQIHLHEPRPLPQLFAILLRLIDKNPKWLKNTLIRSGRRDINLHWNSIGLH